MQLLTDFLTLRYRHPEYWSHPWLAGSGVSYQWQAARQPGDLDCLVGVDFIQFKKANPEFAGLLNGEIAAELNEEFREYLQPQTANWNGYELTFYVNPAATDIRNIHPYAAYDLKYDEWTVSPDPQAAPVDNPEWENLSQSDARMAQQLHTRFTAALNDYRTTQSAPMRTNAMAKLNAAASAAHALYEEIHSNRSLAFSSTGEGYRDFNNFRWQAAKKYGTIDQLREMREYLKSNAEDLYGVELPDASTLIRRAALYRNN